MKRISIFAACAFLIFSCALVSFTAVGPTGIIEDVLTYTNKFRDSKGLNELSANTILNSIAQKHSEDMASGKVRFGHDGFEQRNSVAQKQLSIRNFAENVAFGVNTGEEVVNMWKNSNGHRKNMLGKFTRIGIGVAKDKQGRIFYTQVFSD